MDNPYIDFYKQQAGTGFVGIQGYQGRRYQKGHGFFGRILKSSIYPLLKFFGKKALNVGADIASDVIVDKKDWKTSAKRRLNSTAEDLVKEGVKRAKTMLQKGKGKRKRKALVQDGMGRKRKQSGCGRKKKRVKKKPNRKKSKKSIKRRKSKKLAIEKLLKNVKTN